MGEEEYFRNRRVGLREGVSLSEAWYVGGLLKIKIWDVACLVLFVLLNVWYTFRSSWWDSVDHRDQSTIIDNIRNNQKYISFSIEWKLDGVGPVDKRPSTD